MLSRSKKFHNLTKFRFLSFLFPLLPLTTLLSASLSHLKISLWDKCEKQKSEESLVSICSLYKYQLGSNEKLLEKLSYSKETRESLALKIFDFLNKETSSIEKFESLMELNFTYLNFLLLVIEKVNSIDSHINVKRNILYISALLDVVSILREKFSESLRDLVNPNTLDWTNLKKLASLIKTGIKIVRLRESLVNVVSTYFKMEDYFLWRVSMEKLFASLESVESDAEYYASRVRNANILDPKTRFESLLPTVEWRTSLLSIRTSATSDQLNLFQSTL